MQFQCLFGTIFRDGNEKKKEKRLQVEILLKLKAIFDSADLSKILSCTLKNKSKRPHSTFVVLPTSVDIKASGVKHSANED